MPPGAVQAWLEKADEDVSVFNLIRAAGGPWSQAAYHLQQAAEKLVKAVRSAAFRPLGAGGPHRAG